MGLAEIIAADAAAIVAADGVAVSYTPKGQAARSVKAILRAGSLLTRGTDQDRTLTWDLTAAVAKTDLASIDRNGDRVSVPAAHVPGGSTAAKAYRVAEIVGQDEGWWVLGLRAG